MENAYGTLHSTNHEQWNIMALETFTCSDNDDENLLGMLFIAGSIVEDIFYGKKSNMPITRKIISNTYSLG